MLATGDVREVITDARALYFGALLDDQTLTTDSPNRLGTLHFAEWMAYSLAHAPVPKQGSAAARSAR